jgi:quinol-cytochrome oxidoreductase complex cytochrome b subunit
MKRQLEKAGMTSVDWLDERLGAGAWVRWLLWRNVPKGTDWFSTLGVAALFAFLNQAVTGVVLAMFYRPSANEAYESVRHITNDVFLGQFVRGMHKWGATVMVLCVFLHMATNFFFGAYKYPRELNWLIGVTLLVLTMVMAFTGYVLPFNMRAYWATNVGVDLSSSAPILGPYVADFLRGGSEFTATTLSRFYAIHMLIIPGLVAAMIVAHLYLVVKLGTVAPPWIKAERREQRALQDRTASLSRGAADEGPRRAPAQRAPSPRRSIGATRSE